MTVDHTRDASAAELADSPFVPMLIGGTLRGAASGRAIAAIDPASGTTIAHFPRGDAGDVDAAAAAAEHAVPAWRALNPMERASVVQQIADVVVARADELAHLDVSDNGSPIREMRRDAFIAAAQLRYFAGLALQDRGETIPGDRDRLNYTIRQPFGVVGRIIPFNHPLMFAAGRLAAPLIAGNTVVLKPSEHTSLSALRFGELIADIVPAGVVNVVTGYGTEAGDALAVHPVVRRLAFTGSGAIGRAIQQRAATNIVKTVSLELGGKNPIVVFPDADLDAALDGAVRGMNFTWQGQSCGSTSRLLVHRSIHKAFVERLGAMLDAMRSGLPSDEATETGAIVHRGQFQKVLDYIQVAHAEGARLVAGGSVVTDGAMARGMFVRPTLFDEVAPESRLAREEIFGPVLAVMPFDSYDEALRIANSVSYGLTASVFTRDLATAHTFARDVEAGYVWINDAARHFPGTAYGGIKDSGVGREEGYEELLSYSQTKNVNVNLAAR
jgi:betaine-aldehyde dehydrogenase